MKTRDEGISGPRAEAFAAPAVCVAADDDKGVMNCGRSIVR